MRRSGISPLRKGVRCRQPVYFPTVIIYWRGVETRLRSWKERKGETCRKQISIPRIEQPHAQFRQVNKNKRGNYLVPLFATSEIREISPSGQLLKSVKVDGNPFSVAALDNGNYLVACGDAHCFIELNFETGDIVRKVNANDIEGAQLFVAQLLPKRDGGLYICNWQGHDGEAAKGHYPQLIEINGAGKMVWI